MDQGSDDYRVLRRWIAPGSAPPRKYDPRLTRLDLSPSEGVLSTASRRQLTVTAYFSNGTSLDVTRQAPYESNAKEIADVLATIYQTLGIPLDTHYEDSTGRPVGIGDSRRPIRELL